MSKTGKKTNFVHTMETFVEGKKKILLILLAVFLIALPYMLNSQYLVTVAVKIGSYTLLALGLNVLTGYTGLVSLGHAGFVAIGAYTSSLCAVKLGMNFFASMILGMVVAGLAGVLLGLPTMRVTGTYLSIITLGFGEIIKMIAMNWASVTNGTLGVKNIPRPSVFGYDLVTGTYLSIITLGFGEIIKMIAMNWASVTNGTLGVKNIPRPSVFGYDLTIANNGLYYLMLVLVLVTTLFCIAVVKSKTGRAFQAIRADELASTMMGINITSYKILSFVISACICALGGALYASLIGYIDPNTRADELASTMMGINITSYKILSFVISACICALGGALYASLIGYIDPNTFNFDVSTLILSIVILGGMGTIRGMFVGAAILIAFPEVSRFLMEYRFVFNFDVSTLILSIVILGGMGTIRGMFVGAAILIAFPEVSRFLMEYRFVLYGVILVLMMRFRPQGIMGWKSTMPYRLSKNVKEQVEKMDKNAPLNLLNETKG